MSTEEYFPVVVVGAGPVGTLLSALLSQTFKIRHVVIEKEIAIPQDPRALTLLDWGTRMLQNVGLHKKLTTHIGRGRNLIRFLSGKQIDFNRTPMFKMNASSVECTGFPNDIDFFQPAMEALLRETVNDSGLGLIRTGCEVVNIEEKEDLVYVTYENIASKTRNTIKSHFVVGTDGRRGFTRKMYLEPRGVILEHTHPYKETYIGMNWEVKAPTPESHPDFPLWKLGYSPKDVVDAFIPDDFLILCNPERRGCSDRFGVVSEQKFYWRTEFSVTPGEDPEAMSTRDNSFKFMIPYLTHKGSKYNLLHDVIFPFDCLNLRRSWHYQFEARQCNHWRIGRVMLAGDSAHIFPPFGGQGITAGFLDVSGLAWRLALILRNRDSSQKEGTIESDYFTLLESWEAERKSHIANQLSYTMQIGSILLETNPLKIFIREWSLWLMQFIPSVKKNLEKMPLKPPQYSSIPEDIPSAFQPQMDGGKYWWQVYCKVLRSSASEADLCAGQVCFTDDIIFSRQKEGLFQLVILVDSADEISDKMKQLQTSTNVSSSKLPMQLIQESTIIINNLQAEIPSLNSLVFPGTISRVASADELLTNSPSLYVGSPNLPVQGYDPFALRAQHPNASFVIVRPDRFVYAACEDVVELDKAIASLQRLIE